MKYCKRAASRPTYLDFKTVRIYRYKVNRHVCSNRGTKGVIMTIFVSFSRYGAVPNLTCCTVRRSPSSVDLCGWSTYDMGTWSVQVVWCVPTTTIPGHTIIKKYSDSKKENERGRYALKVTNDNLIIRLFQLSVLRGHFILHVRRAVIIALSMLRYHPT